MCELHMHDSGISIHCLSVLGNPPKIPSNQKCVSQVIAPAMASSDSVPILHVHKIAIDVMLTILEPSRNHKFIGNEADVAIANIPRQKSRI
jgi:hypothetical protein